MGGQILDEQILELGSASEKYGETVCYSYRETDIQAIAAPFSFVESIRYKEFETDDSILFVLRK